MKLAGLGTERMHSRDTLAKPSHAHLESLAEPIALAHQIHTYTELRQQIHRDLRIQHPEWIEANGESPMCDLYEERLNETLGALTRRDTLAQSRVAPFG
jgi:hypothetical protein